MAKHLTKRDVEAILNIIHAHDDHKLSWEGICEAAEAVVGKRPTRQSLSSNEAIKNAYRSKKISLKHKVRKSRNPSSLTVASGRISKLESENEMLKRKNEQLLEQFVIWQYNMYKLGIKESQLSEPLPCIERGKTE